MPEPRRIVTGHDASGKSVVLSDGTPAQHHPMRGASVGADFFEMWNTPKPVPELTSVEGSEPAEREFTIMPVAGSSFENAYDIALTGLEVPKMIDLEAPA